MGTKNNPGKFDCYANADPDEPIFVLLGRDKHAAVLTYLWSILREIDGEDKDVVEEAKVCSENMLLWLENLNKKPVIISDVAWSVFVKLLRVEASRAVLDEMTPR